MRNKCRVGQLLPTNAPNASRSIDHFGVEWLVHRADEIAITDIPPHRAARYHG